MNQSKKFSNPLTVNSEHISLKTPSRIWIFIFLFVSGATSLIYEVVWTRLFTLVIGNTLYSISTVLTAFMGGLALGGYLGGKLIDRRFNPLRVYAFLELGTGLYCLFVPNLIDIASPVFKWIYFNLGESYTQASLARFLVCIIILIIPVTFMGATLPVLSKFFSKDEIFIGKDVGVLYSMNTLGAVFGAWASAFIFMRFLGVQSTIWVAALLNLAISAVIFLVFRPSRKQKDHNATQSSYRPLDRRGKLILLSFGLSGVAAMIYQVVWNRVFFAFTRFLRLCFQLDFNCFYIGTGFGSGELFPTSF